MSITENLLYIYMRAYQIIILTEEGTFLSVQSECQSKWKHLQVKNEKNIQ